MNQPRHDRGSSTLRNLGALVLVAGVLGLLGWIRTLPREQTASASTESMAEAYLRSK